MPHINDVILAAVHIVNNDEQLNDGLLSYYHAHGATSKCLVDAEMEWLRIVHPFSTANHTINDMWYAFLITSGYGIEGEELSDMKMRFWSAGGGTGPIYWTEERAALWDVARTALWDTPRNAGVT